jgi:glycosyltransferase involved in cell wall biosynthesis
MHASRARPRETDKRIRMKILYHHRTLADGAEGIHIREMIRAFERLGYAVTARVPGGVGGRPGLLPRLVRRTLPQALFELAGAAYTRLERRQARRVISSVRPSFVYARHALNDTGVLEAARDTGTPSVLEVNALYSSASHQRFEPLAFRSLARRLEVRAFAIADLVITVSTPLKDLVQEICPRARVLVVPNGVDPERFSPDVNGRAVREQHGLRPDDLVVGWSGVLRAWHGLDVLLNALSRHPSLTLLLIGDGPERARVQEQAEALGLGGRVRVSGYISRDDMPRHLAAIDVGVVADDRTRYASPMKLIEYMAMGKPVVAPDLPNIRDILTHDREGLLFTPGDAGSLAECLETFSNPELRAAHGRRARARVVSDRNWASNARQVIETLSARRPLPRCHDAERALALR